MLAECPKNPAVKAAHERIVSPPQPSAIIATQQPAVCSQVEGGLVQQLAECLRTQQSVPWSVRYQAYLCGPVEHYQGEAFDGGWGRLGCWDCLARPWGV